MAIRMQQRRGTAEQWTLANPVLAEGEIGWESDTNKLKLGDGVHNWDELAYFVDETALSDVDGLPSQTDNEGKFLTTDGTDAFWATVDALPDQTDNAGKYLTTDGTAASWAELNLDAKQDVVADVSDTEIGYLANVTSDIQEQLDSKLETSDLDGYATETYVDDAIEGIPTGTVISETAPDPADGHTLWWNSTNATLYIYYDNAWVQAVAGITGPQGPEGPIGATGASGLEWKGVWDEDATYAANDAVFYNNSSWFASDSISAGEVPSNSSTLWYPLALQGATGATGATGPQGPIGPAGPEGPQGPAADLTGIATEEYVDDAVATKADATHTHTISDITDLQTQLDSKLESTDLDGYATEEYVTDAIAQVGSGLPDQENNAGKFLTTDGAEASWTTLDLSTKQDVVSGVSDTEIGYLEGVTSNIQEQIDGKMSSSNPTIDVDLGLGPESFTLQPVKHPDFPLIQTQPANINGEQTTVVSVYGEISKTSESPQVGNIAKIKGVPSLSQIELEVFSSSRNLTQPRFPDEDDFLIVDMKFVNSSTQNLQAYTDYISTNPESIILFWETGETVSLTATIGPEELGALDGISGNIQDQLDSKVSFSDVDTYATQEYVDNSFINPTIELSFPSPVIESAGFTKFGVPNVATMENNSLFIRGTSPDFTPALLEVGDEFSVVGEDFLLGKIRFKVVSVNTQTSGSNTFYTISTSIVIVGGATPQYTLAQAQQDVQTYVLYGYEGIVISWPTGATTSEDFEITPTELSYLDGLTSNVQEQLDSLAGGVAPNEPQSGTTTMQAASVTSANGNPETLLTFTLPEAGTYVTSIAVRANADFEALGVGQYRITPRTTAGSYNLTLLSGNLQVVSSNRVTLRANRTYMLRASIELTDATFANYGWITAANLGPLGNYGGSMAVNGTSGRSPSAAYALFTPTVDTDVSLFLHFFGGTVGTSNEFGEVSITEIPSTNYWESQKHPVAAIRNSTNTTIIGNPIKCSDAMDSTVTSTQILTVTEQTTYNLTGWDTTNKSVNFLSDNNGRTFVSWFKL